jgi:hypothetical protein
MKFVLLIVEISSFAHEKLADYCCFVKINLPVVNDGEYACSLRFSI